MGTTATQIAIIGSCVANRFDATNGENMTTNIEIAKTIRRRIINEAFTYSSAFSFSPLARCSAIKLTEPDEIPTSAIEVKIETRFRAAEKIPKSAIENFLAIIKVNKNPQKAEKTFPEKSTKVSLAVAEKAKDLTRS